GRDDRGRAHEHVHARNPQAGLDDHHDGLYQGVQDEYGGAGTLPQPHPERSPNYEMTDSEKPFPAPPADKQALEERPVFTPKFDSNGLLTAVVTDADDRTLLMVAHMNA